MQKIAIIIPCYNEEKRLSREAVQNLLETSPADVFLCNDGSTDATLGLLRNISDDLERCFFIDYEKNAGKANTIYKSVNQLLDSGTYDYIGYLDADFSTPVAEASRLIGIQLQNPDKFIIGSRIQLLNSEIRRKHYRHIIGRIIVTIVNLKFKLGIYDTQCGAKIFPAKIASTGFAKPFATSWLFDIELFIRLKNKGMLPHGKEVPLYGWKDIEGSK
ncbi:glycosyltransferase, partial [uncultured Flavobacterium sp.]|uniref:glycosyltransferase n=1 Tax=uncultured Flavobacterium sp. TaxID=165435 RepID=UPI0025F1AA2D